MGTADSNPLVTVIIPVYNTEPYLRRCLDSVCGQTYGNLEIICVNDGSTDGSQSILEEYAARDSRVKALVQENAGQAVARNRALDITRGEWVTGLDSDDWIEPDTYETAMTGMDNDVDIIHFGTWVEDDSPQARPVDNDGYTEVKVNGKTAMTPEILAGTDVYIWNKLFRRETVEQFGIRYPDGYIYEDAAFVYCMGCMSRNIYGIKKKLYHYIQRGCSTMGVTHKKTPRAIEHLGITRYSYDYYVRHGKEKTWCAALANLFNIAYSQTELYLPEGMMEDMRAQAWQLACDMGISDCRHCYSVQALRAWRQGCLARLFHGIYANRDSYGLGPLKLWTVAHSAQGNVHYCCGRRIFERQRGA